MPGDSAGSLQCLFRANDTQHSPGNRAKVDSLSRAYRQQASENRLQRLLLDAHSDALLVCQQGVVVQSNACFDELISCRGTDNTARTQAWRSWLSDDACDYLSSTPCGQIIQDTVICNAAGHSYRTRIDHLVLENGPAQLLRINPDPVTILQARQADSDSVTGLPTRNAFIDEWQRWLERLETSQRYTAFLINLPDIRSESGSNGGNGTLRDLMIFRASSVIEQYFSNAAIVGRTQLHSLLLVQAVRHAYARKNALTLKALLGSLGGLIDNPADISIKTLTLSCGTLLTASEVLSRLEQDESHAWEQQRCAAHTPTPPKRN